MPQHPKLRKKNVGNATYWYTETGGPTYLGNVDEVPYKMAKKLIAAHTQSLFDEKKYSKEEGFTAGDLIAIFLAWIEKHRSHSSYTSKRIYCSRFGDFKIGNNSGSYCIPSAFALNAPKKIPDTNPVGVEYHSSTTTVTEIRS